MAIGIKIRANRPSKVVQLHISTKREVCFLFISKTMKKKHCGDCIFLKYVDVCGDGYCEQLEEADVNVNDEACVLIEEKETKDMDYE